MKLRSGCTHAKCGARGAGVRRTYLEAGQLSPYVNLKAQTAERSFGAPERERVDAGTCHTEHATKTKSVSASRRERASSGETATPDSGSLGEIKASLPSVFVDRTATSMRATSANVAARRSARINRSAAPFWKSNAE